MSNYTFTPSAESGHCGFQEPDAAALVAYQDRLAKLKPACSRCGRTLTKSELDAHRCANTDECRLRQIWRTASSSGVKHPPKLRMESGLDLAGYREQKKLKRERDLAVSA